MNNNLLANYEEFLVRLFNDIAESNIDVDHYQLDHIAYRPLTTENYEILKTQLAEIGDLISEVDDSGRKISIFRLFKPFMFRQYEIPFFELLGPKQNNKYEEGYQHIEFVINCSLEKFMTMYPNIKFNKDHLTSVLNPSIEFEFPNKTGVEFHLKDIGEVVKLQKQYGGMH